MAASRARSWARSDGCWAATTTERRGGLALALVLALISSAAIGAEDGALPISTTYPPADDVRSPDLTIEKAVSGGDAVLAYSTDGRAVATAGGTDPAVRVWNARTGEDLTGELQATLLGHKARIVSLAFGADANTVVALAADRTVKVWDVSTGAVVRTVELKAPPSAPVLRPGKEPVLAQIVGGAVELGSYETGARSRTFAAPGAKVRNAAFSADGKILVAATTKGHLFLWDVETGAVVHDMAAGARGDALGVGVKGDQVAWALPSGEIEVWDATAAQRLCRQKGHLGAVRQVLFNPNGQKMASAGADGTLRYWTVPLPPIAPSDLGKITAALPAKATAAPKKARKLLVFWRADAILHKGGVPAANHAIALLGQKTGAFETHFSRDYAVLDPKVLAAYDAIVLNSTAHIAIPDEARKKALLDYVEGGGGVVGIHAAIDTFKGWPEGAAIVGATFAGHPWHPTGTWAVKVEEPGHPLLAAWSAEPGFKMHDEMYELGAPYSRADRRVLLSLDLADAATAGVTPLHREDKDFAVSWVREHGRGRVFYCMFGHLGDPFQDPRVLRFYLDGIQYALGDLAADATPRAAVAP